MSKLGAKLLKKLMTEGNTGGIPDPLNVSKAPAVVGEKPAPKAKLESVEAQNPHTLTFSDDIPAGQDIYQGSNKESSVNVAGAEEHQYSEDEMILNRFKPKELYLDTATAAAGGMEHLLFGVDGPNAMVNQANAVNLQTFQQNQQMNVPQTTVKQGKLLKTLLKRDQNQTMSSDQQKMNDLQMKSLVPGTTSELPSFLDRTQPLATVGTSYRGEDVVDFHPMAVTTNKKQMEESALWEYLRPYGDPQEVFDNWLKYFTGTMDMENHGSDKILNIRNGRKVFPNKKAMDIFKFFAENGFSPLANHQGTSDNDSKIRAGLTPSGNGNQTSIKDKILSGMANPNLNTGAARDNTRVTPTW